MNKARLKRAAEVALAGGCGLLGTGLDRAENWASGVEHGPHVLTRVCSVVGAVLSPGVIVGSLIGGVLDVGGFTTDWSYLYRIEEAVGIAANCVLFAAVWFVLRTQPKASRLRRVTIAACVVWAMTITPLVALGNWMFAAYGP